MQQYLDTGFVVIGRNEGARLITCLDSALKHSNLIVYVDSGSDDDSVAEAKARGCHVVELDMSVPFTAARARNEGWQALLAQWPQVKYVHFIDGDCELIDSWVPQAVTFLNDHAEYAVVCGRRVEKRPQDSLFNALCDVEWNTPPGDAKSCGGDALIRLSALQEIGGYDPNFIAGEEPEMCFRLRQAGGKIYRLDADMTLHDAAMTRWKQWWKRNKRAGYAYTLGYDKHGHSPEAFKKSEVRRIVFWGGALPLFLLVVSVVLPYGLLAWALYPLQYFRLKRSRKDLGKLAAPWAACNILGKFAEMQGVASFYYDRLTKRQMKIIEYK